MKEAYFNLQWPRDNLYVSGFAHEIMNYRYHWHPDKYELNILLCGSQEFCRCSQTHSLEADDVILVEPGVGHASFGQHANTRALVLHFPASTFKPYVRKDHTFLFPQLLSNADTRDSLPYRRLRFYAAQIYSAVRTGGPFAQLTAKASFELLLSTMCTMFHPQLVKSAPDQDVQRHEVITSLIGYMEQHYTEKITLEELSAFSKYNRTYISTLFKNMTGVNFYEYLTRLRFQNALRELSNTGKNLTDIALDNGFPDLKSFNARFRSTFHRTPAEYRALLSPDRVVTEEGKRCLISQDDPLLQAKLGEYQGVPNTP